MDASELNSAVGQGLEQLGLGLRPVVEGALAEAVPGVGWTRIIEEKDRVAGGGHGRYSATDVSLMLRAMTERIGELGFPFDRVLTRSARGYASELREVRNVWTHNAGFTEQSAYRALDSMQLLLESVGATEQAAVVMELKGRVLSPSTGSGTGAVASTGLADGPEAEDGQSAAGSISVDGAAGSLSAVDAAASSVSMRVSATPTLSYAMAHCSIAVIDEIVLENHGGERRAASVEIDVVTADGALADTEVLLADLGEDRTTLLRSPEVLLDPRRMLLVEEQRPGVIRVTVRDAAGTQLGTVESPVTVLASNQWIAAPCSSASSSSPPTCSPTPSSSASSCSRSPTSSTSRPAPSPPTNSTTPPASTPSSPPSGTPPAPVTSATPNRPPAGARAARRSAPRGGPHQPPRHLPRHHHPARGRPRSHRHPPLLWLLKDHIFLGYWRVQTTLDAVASTDVSEAVNSLELGRIGV